MDVQPWLGLAALVDDIGSRRLWSLITAAGDAERAWRADAATLARARIPEALAQRFLLRRTEVNVAALVEAMERERIAVIPRNDPRYPALLAQIPDPPICLFVRGDAARIGERAIAVVGTRKATAYGRTATEALVGPLARAGLVITSGLAFGIDAYSHDACLRANGRTVAVLGTGSDGASISPASNRGLAERILGSGGCLVTEYVPGTPGFPMHFPARNRIVAGMTSGTVVIEAPEDSGALITAQFALDFGREVFAVPGPITSAMHAGANALLKVGATPTTSAADVIDALHLEELLPPTPPRIHTPEGLPGRILGILGAAPLHIDDLRDQLAIPTNELASALTSLELDGAIRDIGGSNYIRAT